MQAYQLLEWQLPPEPREVDVPEPGPGQVLVEIGGAGACHSDLHLMDWPAGQVPFAPPRSRSDTRTPAGSKPSGPASRGSTSARRWRTLPWECSLTSTYWGTAVELGEVLDLARTGRIRADVQRFPLSEVAGAYASLRAGRVAGRAVICPAG